MSSSLRLQIYLARCGVASRRRAETLITQGRIQVNDKVVTTLGVKIIPGEDRITVNGQVALLERKRCFLFHKPRGVVTTMVDPQGRKCVGDYLENMSERIYPVGRLDRDVSGLLVLTNDGDFAEHMLHPRYGVSRVYWALLQAKPTDEQWKVITRGQMVDGRLVRATLRPVPSSKRLLNCLGKIVSRGFVLELTLTEGRKHVVKRILAQVGCELIQLCRVQFGSYSLGGLRAGEIVEANLPE